MTVVIAVMNWIAEKTCIESVAARPMHIVAVKKTRVRTKGRRGSISPKGQRKNSPVA